MINPSPGDDRHQEDFAAFHRAYRPMLVGYARAMSDRVDHENIADETLVRAWIHWDRLGENPKSWVYKVATNLLRTEARRSSRTLLRPVRDHERPLMASPASDGDHAVELWETLTQVQKLPRKQRQALVLITIGLSPKEIADVMDVTSETVSSYLTKARKKLTNQIGNPERRQRHSRHSRQLGSDPLPEGGDS